MTPENALQAPIPHDLPLALPLARELVLAFLVLSFLLHIVFVNLVVGGSVLSTYFHWIGWKRKMPSYLKLSNYIASTITVNKSLAVVLGVGPLLAMNLAYTLYFYTANALTGVMWIMVVPLVTIAFLLSYAHKYLGHKVSPIVHWLFGAFSTALFLFIPLIFLSNVNLMLFPERWAEIKGFISTLFLPNVLVRYVHFLMASFAATGLFLVWRVQNRALDDTGFNPADLKRKFYQLAFKVTVVQWLVGPTLYFSLPDHGVTWRVTGVILCGVTLSLFFLAVIWAEIRADSEVIGKRLPQAAALFSIVVLFMGTGRHFYREDVTAWHRAKVADRTKEYQDASKIAREEFAKHALMEKEKDPGELKYLKTCAACHQRTGKGLPNAFPPLAGSEWVLEENPDRLISLVLHGMSGEIEVSGSVYKGQMPAQKSALKDRDVAEILSYIRRSWGNQQTEVSSEQVARVRKATRQTPWTQSELGRPGTPYSVR